MQIKFALIGVYIKIHALFFLCFTVQNHSTEVVNGEASTRKTVLTVGFILVALLSALFYVYTSFPELEE